jgi:antitoxin component YwqK of YwqJK toxin-antitoxin module
VGALVSAACGPPSPPEGATRALEKAWQSGVVRTRGTEVYHDGEWVLHGEVVYFDEDGDESHRGPFEYGLESGVWHERYPDGGSARGKYRAGKRHGPWTYMHANGQMAQQGAYKDGARDGVWKFWSPLREPLPDVEYPLPDGAR